MQMPRLIWVFTGSTITLLGFVMSRLKSVQTSLLNNMIAILFIAVPIVEIKQMLVGKDCPLVKGKKVPVYVNFFKKKENPN